MKFDHIGIFVSDLASGREKMAALLPIVSFSDITEDSLLGVRVQFGVDSSGIRYELVAPYGEKNPVSGVLKAGKNILNHVAYRVPNLDESMKKLQAAGCDQLGQPAPALAFGGANVVFFYSPLKFIIELIELG